MNMVDARFRGWYYGGEATEYLSREVGSPIEPETVFVAAIRPKGVRVFLHVPPSMTDKQGQPLAEGLWDLITDKTDKGSGARHHFSKLINTQTPLDGITGAFIKRDGDKQSPRELNPSFWEGRAFGAWPKGCDLAFKEEDLDRLAAMLKRERTTPTKLAEKEASSKTPIRADWKDLTVTFTSEFQVQIHVGANPSHVQTYGDLGLEDQKRKKPTLAWETFRELAEAEPTRLNLPPRKAYDQDVTGDKEQQTIQNRIREINKVLRDALNRLGYMIPVEPAPIILDKKHGCYEPTPGFRIMVSSSYERDESDTSLT
jgi:hypothetical protein